MPLSRVLVGIALIIGMAGGWYAMERQKGTSQLEAARNLEQVGCNALFAYEWNSNSRTPRAGSVPPEAAWVRNLVGDAILRRVVAIDARAARDLDTVMAQLPRLPYLESADFANTQLDDNQVASLQRAPGLQTLDLTGTHVTDRGCAALASLTNLRHLQLGDTLITPRSAAHLAALLHLQSLDLARTGFDALSIHDLQALLPECNINSDFSKPAQSGIVESRPAAGEN